MAFIFGTNGDDDLEGTQGNDLINAYAGNDIVYGWNGNDILLGGSGNDTLDGGDGDDYLAGGDGIDTASYSTALGGVTVNLGLAGSQNTGTAGTDQLASIENLLGSTNSDVLIGNGGNNLINAGIGNDQLYGEAGDDHLAGGSNDDLLDGGAGADYMYGDDGNDTYIVDNLGDVAEDVPEPYYGGLDIVQSSVTHTVGNGIEILTLTGGAAINGTGNEENNTITGNGANNVLWGEDGNDSLNGGGGNDLLRGMVGRDSLTGGAGLDTFDLNSVNESPVGAGNRDVINDFNGAGLADRIDLITIDANGLLGGNQAFTYIGGAAFTAAGQLRYAGGILSGSTDADAAAEFEVQLVGAPALSVGGAGTDILL